MIRPWLLAARPQTLPAGLGPVILALALSSQVVALNKLVAAITIVTTILLQISSNLINDYYDGVSGADTDERLGPQRMVASGVMSPELMKKGFLTTLGLAFTLGLYLMYSGGLPIIIIGLASLFFAWAYTGGPYPLSYYALGEVFALIFFGPVAVWGTYYLQTGNLALNEGVLVWGIAIGLISSALMGINNLRDYHQDKSIGKTTIATLIGTSTMRVVILLFLIISCLLTANILQRPYFYAFIPFLLLSTNWRSLMSKEGVELNIVLANTGKYLFLYSLFFSYLITS